MKSSPGSQFHGSRVEHEVSGTSCYGWTKCLDRVSSRNANFPCVLKNISKAFFIVLHYLFLFVSHVKLTKLWLIKYFITMHFVQ